MAEAFDPYRKWLGIPPAQQPPHHYRLLGIEVFEEDPEVIDTAASQRMSYLQELGGGPHVKESQRLLNEVSAARRCLLDKQKKADYDKTLRAKLNAAAPKAAAKAAPKPPPVEKTSRVGADDETVTVVISDLGLKRKQAAPAKSGDGGKEPRSGEGEAKPVRRRKRSPVPLLLGLTLVGGAAAGGAVFVMQQRAQNVERVEAIPASVEDRFAPVAPSVARTPEPEADFVPAIKPPPQAAAAPSPTGAETPTAGVAFNPDENMFSKNLTATPKATAAATPSRSRDTRTTTTAAIPVATADKKANADFFTPAGGPPVIARPKPTATAKP